MKFNRFDRQLQRALQRHDAILGQSYCDCEEHREARALVIDAARALIGARWHALTKTELRTMERITDAEA